MIRTQIQLSPEQARALKALAQKQGRSMAEVIREGLDAQLRRYGAVDRAELKKRAIAAGGQFRSGVHDLAEEHDRYLAQALAE